MYSGEIQAVNFLAICQTLKEYIWYFEEKLPQLHCQDI